MVRAKTAAARASEARRAEAEGINAIEALPVLRDDRQPLEPRLLAAMTTVLRALEVSSNKRKKPAKADLLGFRWTSWQHC